MTLRRTVVMQIAAGWLLSILLLSTVGWFSVRQPWLIDVGNVTARPYLVGFHAAEQLSAGGGDYQWTEAVARVRLPDAAWPAARRLSLRLIRFEAVAGPLTVEAGGMRAVLGNELTQGGSARIYQLWLPPTDEVTLRSPQAAVPAGDARELGNAIERLSVQRMQGGLPTPWLLLSWTLAALLHWRMAQLLGLRRADTLLLLGVLYGLLLAALAVAPAALVLLFPAVLMLSAGLLLISPLLCRLLQRLRFPEAGGLSAVLLFSWFWKGLAFSYPGFFATDSQFHVHRMAAFLQGELFQTSLGGGTAFPYPLAGYFALLPVVALSNELRWTLQIGALLFDSLTVLLLAVWLRGATGGRAGLFAAATYVLLPVGFIQIFHNPVLHMVGQWLSLLYLTMLVRALQQPEGTVRLWPLTLAALAASLSHFGIFLNLGLMMATALLLQPREAPARWRTWISYPIGVGLSVVLYYSTAFNWDQAQVGSGGEALQGTYGLTGHWEIVRQVLLVHGLWDHYLVVFVPLGAWGVWRWWRASAVSERAGPQLAAAMLLSGALVMLAVATVLFSGTRYMAFIYAPLSLGVGYLAAEWSTGVWGRAALRLIFAVTALIVLGTWFARFALQQGYWFLL
jgi:hypothetical protein